MNILFTIKLKVNAYTFIVVTNRHQTEEYKYKLKYSLIFFPF